MVSTLDEPGLLTSIWRDGRGLLPVMALGLLAAGGFAWFLAVTNQLLPYYLAWLTISEADLRARSPAGGSSTSWPTTGPPSEGHRRDQRPVPVADPLPARGGRGTWAWWLLAPGGGFGFITFLLSYLGTGYLDSWHGLATLVLLPLFVVGLARTWPELRRPRGIRSLLDRRGWLDLRSGAGVGRALLLLTVPRSGSWSPARRS